MDNGYVFSFTWQPPYENDPGMGDGFLAIYDDGANTRSRSLSLLPRLKVAKIFLPVVCRYYRFGSTPSNVEVDTISASDVGFLLQQQLQ